MTVKEKKEYLVRELETVSDSPLFEATELLIDALGADRGKFLYEQNRRLSKSESLTIKRNLARRKRGIPLQYILREWEFYSLSFKVGRGVLIPRADSEILVDLAIEELHLSDHREVFDLCAGSGALGIAIAHNCPQARVTLVEKSRAAFKYLKKNCELNNTKANLVCGDVETWSPPQKADLIVSNPPYISKEEMKKLQREVKHEPTMALYGGRDGLRFYRILCNRANELLNSGGRLMVEIGWKQGQEVKGIFERYGFESVEILQDYSGNDRVVSGIWYK